MRRLSILLLVLASSTAMLAACGEIDDFPDDNGDGGAGGESNGSGGGAVGGAGGETGPDPFVPGFFNEPGILPVSIPEVVRTAGYSSDSPELRVMDAFSTVRGAFNDFVAECGFATSGIENNLINSSYADFCASACLLEYGSCDDAATYACKAIVTPAEASSTDLEDCLASCEADSFDCADDSATGVTACDLTVDCDDASDENDCGDFVFMCDDGEAVTGNARCDGVDDCADKSDEAGCGSEGFLCDDGMRIGTIEQCDNVEDCDGGEDEVGCDDLLFSCDDDSLYSWYRACDLASDCVGGEDELGCYTPDYDAACP